MVLSLLAVLFACWLWKYSSRGQQSTVNGKHCISVLKAPSQVSAGVPGFSSISSLSIRTSCSIEPLQNTARLASSRFLGPFWGFILEWPTVNRFWLNSGIAEVPWGSCYPLPSKAKARPLLFPQSWLWCLTFIVNVSGFRVVWESYFWACLQGLLQRDWTKWRGHHTTGCGPRLNKRGKGKATSTAFLGPSVRTCGPRTGSLTPCCPGAAHQPPSLPGLAAPSHCEPKQTLSSGLFLFYSLLQQWEKVINKPAIIFYEFSSNVWINLA